MRNRTYFLHVLLPNNRRSLSSVGNSSLLADDVLLKDERIVCKIICGTSGLWCRFWIFKVGSTVDGKKLECQSEAERDTNPQRKGIKAKTKS